MLLLFLYNFLFPVHLMDQPSNDVELTLSEARADFSSLCKRVREENLRVVVTRWGRPMAVLVSPQEAKDVQTSLRFKKPRGIYAVSK